MLEPFDFRKATLCELFAARVDPRELRYRFMLRREIFDEIRGREIWPSVEIEFARISLDDGRQLELPACLFDVKEIGATFPVDAREFDRAALTTMERVKNVSLETKEKAHG